MQTLQKSAETGFVLPLGRGAITETRICASAAAAAASPRSALDFLRGAAFSSRRAAADVLRAT